MSSHSSSDDPGSEPARFACDWSPNGIEAASVQVAGELDMATTPRLEEVVGEALEHGRLVIVDVRGLSFVDSAGLHVLLDATRQARQGGARLLLVGASAELERLFELTGTRALLEILPSPPPATGVRDDAASMPRVPAADPRLADTAPTASIGAVDPIKNPVNAQIVTARVMDIPDRALWAHAPDGAIRRAWAPASTGVGVPAGGRVELYLDHHGAVNGWWHPDSGLAVNQRRLAPGAEPVTAEALACQGQCGVLWRAPAAARLVEHDEHCLTCAGALALL